MLNNTRRAADHSLTARLYRITAGGEVHSPERRALALALAEIAEDCAAYRSR